MKKALRIILYVAFGIYCLVLVKYLFIDGRSGTESSVGLYFRQSNLIPLKTVIDYIQKVNDGKLNADIAVRGIIGNLIVLFPIGCFLPCLSKRFQKYTSTLFTAFCVVLAVELLQPLLRVGYFDIDDFILNLSGASLGYLTVRIPFIRSLLSKLNFYKE